MEVFDDQKKLNNIQVQKMKNKLGTRQLPTAELLLDGAVAYRVIVWIGIQHVSGRLSVRIPPRPCSSFTLHMYMFISLHKHHALKSKVKFAGMRGFDRGTESVEEHNECCLFSVVICAG